MAVELVARGFGQQWFDDASAERGKREGGIQFRVAIGSGAIAILKEVMGTSPSSGNERVGGIRLAAPDGGEVPFGRQSGAGTPQIAEIVDVFDDIAAYDDIRGGAVVLKCAGHR